ncbi:hypothetical protein J2Z23_001904 [Lederbergia galactosidilyticus]|nr:hypothetical protein [Lederbergia galactosidilytica]
MTEKQIEDFDRVISAGKEFIAANIHYWKE